MSRRTCRPHRARLLSLLLAAGTMPATATTFVTTDMTIANGNPMAGNYTGSTVHIGASFANGNWQPVLDVKVDVLPSAAFNYSDQTGGGLVARSNSAVQVYGGSFTQISSTGFGGGIGVLDTARVNISDGSMGGLSISGAAPGVSGARVDMTGGTVQNYRGIVAGVQNGVLNMGGGTIRSTSGQPTLVGSTGATISISGGLVQSDGGTAVVVQGSSAFTMTGGTVTAMTVAGGGILVSDLTGPAAQLRGGTVNNGVRAVRGIAETPSRQVVLGGDIAVNGGVFATAAAAIEVDGGTYGIYGGASGAHFSILGSEAINFVGNDLALSGPVAGSLFFENTFIGNFYTFTAGTLASGQSAVGLRVFDAISLGGSTAGFQGGVTLSAVPEPGALALALAGLPVLAGALRRRRAH